MYQRNSQLRFCVAPPTILLMLIMTRLWTIARILGTRQRTTKDGFILIVIHFIKVQFISSRQFLVQVRSFLGRRIEICLFSGFFYEWFQTNEDFSWTDSAWPLVSCPSRVVVLVNWGGATTRPPRLVNYSRDYHSLSFLTRFREKFRSSGSVVDCGLWFYPSSQSTSRAAIRLRSLTFRPEFDRWH